MACKKHRRRPGATSSCASPHPPSFDRGCPPRPWRHRIAANLVRRPLRRVWSWHAPLRERPLPYYNYVCIAIYLALALALALAPSARDRRQETGDRNSEALLHPRRTRRLSESCCQPSCVCLSSHKNRASTACPTPAPIKAQLRISSYPISSSTAKCTSRSSSLSFAFSQPNPRPAQVAPHAP